MGPGERGLCHGAPPLEGINAGLTEWVRTHRSGLVQKEMSS
jgi:hypothetical protein